MVDIPSPTVEIRRGKKERNHGKNIMVCPITIRATIIKLKFDMVEHNISSSSRTKFGPDGQRRWVQKLPTFNS